MKNIPRFFRDLKQYTKYIWISAMSELRSEVANSYLNWLWWILEPLAFMLIYSFVFGYVLGAKEPYFELFIFIGLTLWGFFNRTIGASVRIVKQNKAIVKKVYMPKFVLVLQKMTVNFIKMLFSIGIIIVMLFYFQVPLTWVALYVIPSFITFMLFTFGFSLIIAHFGVFIEDLSNVVRIGMRMLFYISGVFFSVEKRLPDPYALWFAKFNPIAFLLTSVREPLLHAQEPNWQWLLIWFGISLLTVLLGISMVYKNENTYVKVI